MSDRPQELTVDQLWAPCDPSQLAFETTESLPGDIMVIGQERAVRAIDMGVGIASFGFNVFALGYTGTGRTTTIQTFLARVAADQPLPTDWVYVNNFVDPNQPRAICLPSGTAASFRRDMDEMVSDLLREIPRAFESEDYARQKEQIVFEMQEKSNEAFAQLEQKVSEQGFTVVKTAMGLGIAPVLNGQVLTPESYQRLDDATRTSIEERQQQLQSIVGASMRAVRDLEKNTKRRVVEFDRAVADSVVNHGLIELKEKYGQEPEVLEYLAEVRKDLVDNVQAFKEEAGQPGEAMAAALQSSQREDLLRRYKVNVIVDQSQQSGAPVVFETNPTYGNLLGRIEHRAQFGALVTDFTMIKAGALHRANGGYLVAEIRAVLSNPLAWDALKRALKNEQIRTEEMGAQYQLVSTVTLEPEPIPLALKVLLIGDALSYYLLHEYDEDFRKLFKVQAEFNEDFERCAETCEEYARFVAARCHEEGLCHFDRGAVARVIEHGSRLAEHQKKLATRFGEVADLIREASYWAKRHTAEAGEGTVPAVTTAADVQKAIDEGAYRAKRAEERTQELIEDGTFRLDVQGEAIGQVNGLSVLALGNYSFGRPSRITVQTFTGKAGVVSLDREAKLSGKIYDKGLLTLNGYLGAKYAQASPLSLSASISFEQLYEEIEGDSASSTELYALLSSLSRLPLRQGIAVTGSVDQQGNVQPVGGVNEKIEGFFEACRRRGLTGEQGVILPAQNVVNLVLRGDVRQAVSEGRFHIYPVRSIDEGLEILTGVQAGERQDDGTYPPGSVHARVMARLEEIAENLKGTEKEEEKGKGNRDKPATAEKDTTGSCPGEPASAP